MNYHPITFFDNYNLKPRPQQTAVLDALHQNWSKFDYFALSLPTGVGKTYIADGIADSLGTAYILTSTLQLQNQYEKSWNKIVNLKGRGNYTCNVNPNFTVDAAPCSANSDLYANCMQTSACSYYNQKNLALKSKAMITNPVYMLYSTHCGMMKDEEQPWVKRDVLIIDEAHNLEAHLVSFAESDVDPMMYHEQFGCATDRLQFTGDIGHDYMLVVQIRDILMEKAEEMKAAMEREFPAAKLVGVDLKTWARGFSAKAAEKVQKMQKKANALDKCIQPLKIFFNTHSTPEELSRRWLVSKVSDKNVLKLAPVYGDFLFHEYFGTLASKFVFLSATLGTKRAFSKELGLKEDEMFYMETDSPFDPAKSPIIVMPSIKLSKDHYEANVKKVGGLIDEILKMHPDQRGIIHSVTYDIQKHIFNQVDLLNRRRLLCRDMDILNGTTNGKDRYPKKYSNGELLELHENAATKNTVLLSPSMMEGVDLHDDLSEFQVIIKLPWANLGDLRIKTKSQIDSEWYQNLMWVQILQASGRSTRHETDTSVTYILDSNFKYFYDQWKSKLPGWFKNRLVF